MDSKTLHIKEQKCSFRELQKLPTVLNNLIRSYVPLKEFLLALLTEEINFSDKELCVRYNHECQQEDTIEEYQDSFLLFCEFQNKKKYIKETIQKLKNQENKHKQQLAELILKHPSDNIMINEYKTQISSLTRIHNSMIKRYQDDIIFSSENIRKNNSSYRMFQGISFERKTENQENNSFLWGQEEHHEESKTEAIRKKEQKIEHFIHLLIHSALKSKKYLSLDRLFQDIIINFFQKEQINGNFILKKFQYLELFKRYCKNKNSEGCCYQFKRGRLRNHFCLQSCLGNEIKYCHKHLKMKSVKKEIEEGKHINSNFKIYQQTFQLVVN